MCLDNKAIQLLQAINQLIDRAVTNNAIQSTGTVVLPACIRLLFPLLHAEKIRRTFSCKRFISLRDLGEHKFEPSLRKSISRTATFRRFERDEIGFISYLQAPDHF